MRANRDDLAMLLNLQHVDVELLRAQKKLAELPQRQAILAMREKMASIKEKHEKIAALKKDAEHKLIRVSDEDAQLAEKQRATQAAIDEARGDYRGIEARTKELNGFAKRRATLEGELDKLGAELDKITQLESQVERAYDDVARQEAALVASFQEEGGALKNALARMEAQRKVISVGIPASLLGEYERAAKRCGGIGISRLSEGRCGACRSSIEGGRLIELKNQAPLGTCPHCKRLLVV